MSENSTRTGESDVCPRKEDYRVGWICALPLELAAASCMLDKVYPRLPLRSGDTNMYKLGSIGPHNIVIACLPAGEIGTVSAATVALRMKHSFPALESGLMVGIGGGVPSGDHDIRLGDIVVSQPHDNSGGVVQYDFGRSLTNGTLQRLGSLDKPPKILLSALSTLQCEHACDGPKTLQILEEAIVKHPRRRQAWTYLGAQADRLFMPEYVHESSVSRSCVECSAAYVVQRDQRLTEDPVIHYGVIASGNQVMKDGVKREQLRKEFDVLCFEMEAAGLMDDFPCLVIRGICDYSDSHKNKEWQEYAAAVAAAYAKELLLEIPTGEDDAQPQGNQRQRNDSKQGGGGNNFYFNNHGTVGSQIGQQTNSGPMYFGTVNNRQV